MLLSTISRIQRSVPTIPPQGVTLIDIMELGAIGELVGGLAVVGSLIYLAAQVRQSNRLEKAESSRAATRDYINTMQWMDTSLFRRGAVDFSQLSKDDQMQFHNWLAAFFWVGQNELEVARFDEVILLDEGGRARD